MRMAVTAVAVLALMVPQAPAAASPFMVEMCGSAGLRMALPTKLPLPGKGDGDGCCKQGCHAANDRKKRALGQADDADGEDDCCA